MSGWRESRHAPPTTDRHHPVMYRSIALLLVVAIAAALEPDDARHLLRRTGFTPTPDEVAVLLPLDQTTRPWPTSIGSGTTSGRPPHGSPTTTPGIPSGC